MRDRLVALGMIGLGSLLAGFALWRLFVSRGDVVYFLRVGVLLFVVLTGWMLIQIGLEQRHDGPPH